MYFVDQNGLFSIHVEFQYNRVNKGILILYDKQGNLVNCWEAKGLGFAANHENRLDKYADTPTGTYSIKEIIRNLDPKVWSKKSFGPHGFIRMDPESGEALDAEEAGRTGLLIHGGDLGDWKEEFGNSLRKTGGCIRLSNDDMLELLNEIDNLNEEPEKIDIHNIEDDIPDIDRDDDLADWW